MRSPLHLVVLRWCARSPCRARGLRAAAGVSGCPTALRHSGRRLRSVARAERSDRWWPGYRVVHGTRWSGRRRPSASVRFCRASSSTLSSAVPSAQLGIRFRRELSARAVLTDPTECGEIAPALAPHWRAYAQNRFPSAVQADASSRPRPKNRRKDRYLAGDCARRTGGTGSLSEEPA